MGDVGERYVAEDPAIGPGRVRLPRTQPRRRAARAAVLVIALVLASGTLGELPAQPRLVGTVVASRAFPTTPVVDTTGVWPPRAARVAPGPGGGVAVVPVVPVPPVPAPAQPGPVEERPAPFTTDLPDQRVQVALNTAMAQVGLPYVWGGDGPTNGDAGFDCSGLTTFSYAAAGIGLPRTAHTQYYRGPHVAPTGAVLPGDLLFYGTPARVHHVGMYIGDGKMVNAPTFGKPVQVAFYRWAGDDYLGATRPAANGSTTGLLPYAPPAPVVPTQPRDFPAPVAPAPTVVPQAPVAQLVQPVQAAAVTPEEVAPVVPGTSSSTSPTRTPTPPPAAESAGVTTTTTSPPPSTTTTTTPSTPTTPTSSASKPTTPKPITTKPTTSKPTTTKPTTTTPTTTKPSTTKATTTTSSPSTVVTSSSKTNSAAAAKKSTVDDADAGDGDTTDTGDAG